MNNVTRKKDANVLSVYKYYRYRVINIIYRLGTVTHVNQLYVNGIDIRLNIVCSSLLFRARVLYLCRHIGNGVLFGKRIEFT